MFFFKVYLDLVQYLRDCCRHCLILHNKGTRSDNHWTSDEKGKFTLKCREFRDKIMILMIVNIIINIFTIVDYDSNDVQTASLVVCLIRLQLDCFSTLIVSLLLQSLKFALWLIKRMITLLITLTIIRTMAMITSSCCLFFYRIKCILQQKKFNTTCEAQGILIGGSSACLGSAKLDWFLCFLLPRLFSYSSFTIRGGGICIETSS